jgi:hypothetical protein
MRAVKRSALLIGGTVIAAAALIGGVWLALPMRDPEPTHVPVVRAARAGAVIPAVFRSVPPPQPIAVARPLPPLNDPLLEGLIEDDPALSPTVSHAGLHAEVRKERRDADWAPRAEMALLGNIATIPYLDRNAVPRVTCGATLCEVAVTLSAAINRAQANEALDFLQSSDLIGAQGARAQLDSDYHSAAVGPTKRNRHGTVVVRYIPRLT